MFRPLYQRDGVEKVYRKGALWRESTIQNFLYLTVTQATDPLTITHDGTLAHGSSGTM